MTEIYDTNPMPHILDVKCPDCQAHATFYFATGVTIRERKDLGYFEKSQAFEVEKFQSDSGGFGHVAIHYRGLHTDLSALIDLPDGYTPKMWDYPKNYSRLKMENGAIRCLCGYRRKHALSWPDDAWFRIEHRGQTLWAFSRDHAAELLQYIEADHRHKSDYKYRFFLLKVPSHFMSAKARDDVAAKLRRLLVA